MNQALHANPRPPTDRELIAVGYCRRSTDRQEQSIPDQRAAIEKYATDNGITLLRFYIDDAISGTSTVGRKSFQQLIEDATRRSCDFGLVIVYDVKRFGRVDNDEAGYYRHILKTNGVEVVYVSENFTGDRTDDLLRPVKQWQAREESKDLSKVTIRGLLFKIGPNGASRASLRSTADGPENKNTSETGGWWMGGVPPHGYDLAYQNHAGEFLFHLRYHPDCTKQMFDQQWKLIRTLSKGEGVAVSQKDRAKLVPSETERVATIQRIFRLFVEEGRGFKFIAQILNKEGVTPARSREWCRLYSGNWYASTIRAMLINPAYAGDLAWNKRTDGRFHRIVKGIAVERKGDRARRLEWNNEEDWIIVRDAHPPLVSRRIWESARQILRQKSESRSQRGVNSRTGEPVNSANVPWVGPRAKFVLSGLITCGRCGNRYEGRVNYGKRSDEERHHRKKSFVYGCGGHIRYGRKVCILGAVPHQLTETAIADALKAYYHDLSGDAGRQKVAEHLNVTLGYNQNDIKTRRKEISTRLAKNSTTTRNLLDNITPINRDLVDHRIAELKIECGQLEDERKALEHMAVTSGEIDALLHDVTGFIDGLPAALASDSTDIRQWALRRCIERIVVNAEASGFDVHVRRLPTTALGSKKSDTDSVVVGLRP